MSDFQTFDQDNSSRNQEMMSTFCGELSENILNLESALIELENSRNSKDQINHTFRIFHNTKGSAAMMGFNILVDVANWGESLLDLVRNDKLTLATEHVDLLLTAVTAMREISDRLKSQGNEGTERYFKLLAKLQEASESTGDLKAAGAKDSEQEIDPGLQRPKSHEDDLIKVSRALIDQLMLLVSDFMLVKNRFSWISHRYPRDVELSDNCRELEIFSSKLQQNAFKLRLSPIGPIFTGMQRVVRTTAADCKKKVTLDIQGGETLLDRAIVDALGEPLIHLVRNAIDHGLEPPSDRLKANKPQEGQVTLTAAYRSGEVYLSITDDGRGIDANKIMEIGIKKGIITQAQGEAMTPMDKLNLIFLPGFSSAEVISKTSGRGVGMDIVRSAIEKIGGHIEIITALSVGTTFALHLPLSLAIVECLGFIVGGQSYSIPQANVEEVYSLHSNQIHESIKTLADGTQVIVVRDVPIPILSLCKIFERKVEKHNALVLVRHGKLRFILEVDHVIGPISIVSQPLPNAFPNSQYYSGVTKQGDGSLLFLVDTSKLSTLVHQIPVTEAKKSKYITSEGKTASAATLTSSDLRRLQQKIITFCNYQHFCIPVQRAKQIVYVDRKKMNFIRDDGPSFMVLEGQTIPLIWIEELILKKPRIIREQYSVVIVTIRKQSYGIPLADFNGIKRMPENYDRSLVYPGISGSTVLDDETVLVADINELVDLATESPEVRAKKSNKKSVKILTAEDDGFFASEMISSLKSAGYETVLCHDGLEAKKALENEEFTKTIDLIITDIEMPNLNGIGLIRWLKATPHTKHLPCIVHTAVVSLEMRAKAAQAGALALVSKLNSEHLLSEVASVLKGEESTNSLKDLLTEQKKTSRRYVTFALEDHWFALPMDSIKEVSLPTTCAPIPASKPWMQAVTYFRGQVIPIIDLNKFFAIKPPGELAPSRQEQIVIDHDHHCFAALTGQVGEVIDLTNMEQGEGVSRDLSIPVGIAEYAKTTFNDKGRIITILDVGALCKLLDPEQKGTKTLEKGAA